MVRIVCTDESGNSCTLSINPDSPLEDLQVLIEVELSILVAEQQLVLTDGRVLRSDLTLAAQGIDKDTNVTVRRINHHEDRLTSQSQTESQPHIKTHQPVALDDADTRIMQIFSVGANRGVGPLINETDPDVQRQIYDEIHWENVNENLMKAHELTPEIFVGVHMLYVDCEINKVKIKAFIDSGAQVSVINVRTAERCGLMRLVDTRAAVLVHGVGERRTVGRIHMAVVNLGGLHIPFSLNVIDDVKIDFIMGLDQLMRHRMIIDLRANCLRIEDTVIPFLSESEVPRPTTEQVVGDDAAATGTDASGGANRRKVEGSTMDQAAVIEKKRGVPVKEQLPGQPVTDGLVADKENSVVALMRLTGASRDGAIMLLEAADWNVNLAVSLFLDDQ